MAYKVIWSPEAIATFDSIVKYIANKFSDKEVSRFIKTVNRRLFLMSKLPYLARKTAPTSKRRRVVIHKRTIMFYTIKERKKAIEIIGFFDTRQKLPRKNL